jgi:hypothetical protein
MGESSPAVGRDVPLRPPADPGLRRATAQDVHRLKAVPAEAFFEDPILGWLMPDDSKRRARLRRFFAIELRIGASRRVEGQRARSILNQPRTTAGSAGALKEPRPRAPTAGHRAQRERT